MSVKVLKNNLVEQLSYIDTSKEALAEQLITKFGVLLRDILRADGKTLESEGLLNKDGTLKLLGEWAVAINGTVVTTGNSLTITKDNGTTEGKDKWTFNGSEPKSINFGKNAFSSEDFLPLSGGTVYGNTTFTNATAIDSATIGNLIVSGSANINGNITSADNLNKSGFGILYQAGSKSTNITTPSAPTVASSFRNSYLKALVTTDASLNKTYTYSWVDASSIKSEDNTVIFNGQLSLNISAWTNILKNSSSAMTGMDSGTYILQINCGNVYTSGIFSWYNGTDEFEEEIVLHAAGTPQGLRLYARISGKLLQLSSDESTGTNRTYKITVNKII